MSTSPKHTPGPWRHETIQVKEFEEIGVRRKMFGADGQLMLWQEPYFKNPFDRLYDVVRLSDADWPLISAAPEMFQALRELVKLAMYWEQKRYSLTHEEMMPYKYQPEIYAALRAIAKAEGRELP